MKKTMFVMVLALIAALAPAMAFAASPWTQKADYSGKVTAKFQYGFRNTLLGWTKLFSDPEEAGKQKTCVAKGIVKGLVDTVLVTVGGALHLVTFLVPQIDVPIPGNGV